METPKTSSTLTWRDLSGDQVYHVAHFENEFRNELALKLSRAAFSSNLNDVRTFEVQAEIDALGAQQQMWLGLLAENRGMVAERPGRVIPPAAAEQHKSTTHADEVRSARRNAGLTQVELARRAGVSASYIAHIELGNRNPTAELLVRIQEVFSV